VDAAHGAEHPALPLANLGLTLLVVAGQMGQQHFDPQQAMRQQAQAQAALQGHAQAAQPPPPQPPAQHQQQPAQVQPQQQHMGMMYPPQYQGWDMQAYQQQLQQQATSYPAHYQYPAQYPAYQQQWQRRRPKKKWAEHDYDAGGGGSHGSPQFGGRFAQDVPWSELVGKIASLTMTQHGSIALQTRIDNAGAKTPEYISTSIAELEGSMTEGMTNKYGSHLMRRVVELCTEEERTKIVREIADDVVEISRCRFGTWTIQKLVESLGDAEQIS